MCASGRRGDAQPVRRRLRDRKRVVKIPGEIHTLAVDPRSGWLYGTQNGETELMVVRPRRR
ncbi:hypothetical protein GOARA_028_00090 [Gordonia araii NBRC 100433]|uniref:Uncharacterized protein n=1 Tax=Gordonia araii NBRC 100433 TaxID=1073574 RepID=G7GZS3_9ACTN|nr:hypothetical protein GOARA_028_00090 [Gordonia araii NBRC 100433]